MRVIPTSTTPSPNAWADRTRRLDESDPVAGMGARDATVNAALSVRLLVAPVPVTVQSPGVLGAFTRSDASPDPLAVTLVASPHVLVTLMVSPGANPVNVTVMGWFGVVSGSSTLSDGGPEYGLA